MERPELNRNMDSTVFREFYYLKEELVAFCRQEKLPTSGGKLELTERIAQYLETGEVKAAAQGRKTAGTPRAFVSEITEDTQIEENFVCSEVHRAFFREKIGKSFSFKVPFQNWLKSHAGLTYRDAIDAYARIMEEKKNSKTVIDKQFEYNTYIRDFFASNPGKSLEEAIVCWKYKKSLPGSNRYEASDLSAID